MSRAFYTYLLFTGLLLPATLITRAQDGAIDTTFNVNDVGFDFGNGANDWVRTIVRQPDGLILIGGDFTAVDGFQRGRIARLNSDGTVDETFAPTGTSGGTPEVYACALQVDGKILIAGDFTSVNGTARGRIARLNIDGSLDASFTTGTGASDVIRSLSLQPDGRLVIGGDFGSYAGTPRARIARLNADGSLDTSFNPGGGVGAGVVHAVLVQPDGKVVIGGTFYTYDGTARSRVAMLHDDGELDTLFNYTSPGVTSGVNTSVDHIALQNDGKLILAGTFTGYNYVPINGLVRVNTFGSVDNTFTSGLGTTNSVKDIAIQPDGRIIIVGSFNAYGGVNAEGMARLNADGSFDPSFDAGDGPYGSVFTVDLAPDGSLYAGGTFSFFDDYARGHAVHLDASGVVDLDFMAGSGADGWVLTTLLQPDGRIIIGGSFTRFNGHQRRYLARLMPDGELDMSFDAGGNIHSAFPRTLEIQPDGKILVGGNFSEFNGVPRDCIARLHPDGSLDTTFDAGDLDGGGNDRVEDIIVLADGKILIAGDFGQVNGTFIRGIARLHADGSLDTTFGVPLNDGFTGGESLYCMAWQPDGKIVVGGSFNSFGTTVCSNLTRLNEDGSLDPTFFNSPGTSGWVTSLAVQPDGKILAGGHFQTLFGVGRNRVGRLNADGSVDPSFDPGEGVSPNLAAPIVHQLDVLPDGRIMIVGDFDEYDEVQRKAIARLQSDGSLDPTFDPGTGTDLCCIYAMSVQPDGRVVIAGHFTAYNGTGRNRVARVMSDFTTAAPEVPILYASIFPNPSEGAFSIATGQSGPLEVTVMDALGRLVWSTPRYMPGNVIDLESLAGCYQVSISDGHHRTMAKLVME